jgi:hypothetical protein
LDYKTEFNVKGQLTDRLDNGQLKGEFDLTLPTGHHFTGKVGIIVISYYGVKICLEFKNRI